MKDKRNKHIKILAQKIVDLESEMRLGKNVQENQKKIENIISSLSFEDIIEVDNYIIDKKFLS